jgi:hypothetical protein
MARVWNDPGERDDQKERDAIQGYYDGEEGFADAALEPKNLRKRFLIIASSSQGLSALLHIIVISLLGTLYLAGPPPRKEARILARREIAEKPYEPMLEPDLYDRPRIDPTEKEFQPIRLEEELEKKVIPKGIDLEQPANKNTDIAGMVDVFGPGGGGCTPYGHRYGKPDLAGKGGGPGTKAAVRAALRWLATHQSPDGRWDADGWNRQCRQNACRGPDGRPGLGDARYDEGVTALALLAFHGHGQTHRIGRFKRTVRKGIRFLIRCQKPDGSVGFRTDHGESIYSHALATMALCEAWAMTRDFTLKKPARMALDFCLLAQNPGAGWKYGVKPGRSDTSVTGWMVLALKAARVAEFPVPAKAFQGARAWLARATSRETGEAGYHYPGDGGSYLPGNKGKYRPVPTMTAVAVLCRLFMGESRKDPGLKKGVDILLKSLPRWPEPGGWSPGSPDFSGPSSARPSPVNMYYWYYATYALFQFGGTPWKRWNVAMKKALLRHQRRGGCEEGSWDPTGEWGIAGGRVYATAMGCLTLEIYYRYERVK